MKKRLISLLLAFSMMLTFLPAGAVSAFAEEGIDSSKGTLIPNNYPDGVYHITEANTTYQMEGTYNFPIEITATGVTINIIGNITYGFEGYHDESKAISYLINVKPTGGVTIDNYANYNVTTSKSDCGFVATWGTRTAQNPNAPAGSAIINGGIYTTLDQEPLWNSQGVMTLTNVTAECQNDLAVTNRAGTMIIDGGNYKSINSRAIDNNRSGTMTIQGKPEVVAQNDAALYSVSGIVTVVSGTFKDSAKGIDLQGGSVVLKDAEFSGNRADIYLNTGKQITIEKTFNHNATVACADPKDGRQLTTSTTGTDYQKNLNLTSANADYLVDYKKTTDGQEYRCFSKLVGVTISGLKGEIKAEDTAEFTVTLTHENSTGTGILTFGDKNSEIEYKDEESGEYKPMPDDGLPIKLASDKNDYAFRITPKDAGEQKLTAAVVRDDVELGTADKDYTVAGRVHTTVTIEGLEDAVVKEGESKDFTVKVDPKDDAKLGEAFIDFGDKNSEIEYKDEHGAYQPMPNGGLKINLGNGEVEHEFRITPKETGKQTLTAAVVRDAVELGTAEEDFTVAGRVHTTVTIEGLEDAVIKEGESKDFTVKVTPNDDAKLGEAVIDFGDKNSEIEYKDENGEYKPMPEGGLKIGLGDGEVEREFRIAPKETGKQTLTAAVKQGEKKLAKVEKDFVVSEMPILTLKDGVITSVTVPGKDGADPEDITEIVKKNANEDGSFHVPEGATVSVAFDKDAFADSGLKFGHWDITGLDDPNAYQNKESFDFVMPAKGVTLKAMTQDASIEDDEPDIVGPIVIGTTVVVGGAVLGYQAYSLGAEFAGKLLNLPYFPSNRSALAMMLWEDAGKPMPESELLYPDVGQEERDMDLQHAARWAMENELIPDLNDEGTAPEEMKFYPDNAVSKIDVLNAWQKAQELKQNA